MGGGASKETYVLRADENISSSRVSIKKLVSSRKLVQPIDEGITLPGIMGNKLIKTTSTLKHTSSRKLPAISSKSGNKLSEKFPWILKSANFAAMSLDHFNVGRVIGTGLMGTVRISSLKDSKAFFVLKAIRKDYILKHHDERHVKGEREALQNFTSNFCINLFGTFQDAECIYFALEIAIGGELFRRLSKKEAFGPQTAKFYAVEIFSALEHIQSLGYVYRDLKPENVMLDEDGHCKLVDFGFTIRSDGDMIHTVCGTPAYLSPEQLEGKFTNGYTHIVDWWSFGVFLYELLTGKTPFCRNNRESSYEIYLRILQKTISFPRHMDTQSKDLISQMCFPDPTKRLSSAPLIKAHAYFSVDWDAVERRQMVPPFVPRIKEVGDDHYFEDYHDPGFRKGGAKDGGGDAWFLSDF